MRRNFSTARFLPRGFSIWRMVRRPVTTDSSKRGQLSSVLNPVCVRVSANLQKEIAPMKRKQGEEENDT